LQRQSKKNLQTQIIRIPNTDHIFSSHAVGGILTAFGKALDWESILSVAEHFMTLLSANGGQTFNLHDSYMISAFRFFSVAITLRIFHCVTIG